MRKWLISLVVLALFSGSLAWALTAPKLLPDDAFAGLSGDATRGEAVFWAAGCASCHAAPGAEGDDKFLLSGGERFASPFGTFIAPNISPDMDHGIGRFSLQDFGNAVMRGVSPEGAHYFPAFPYTTYARAAPQDITDLFTFWQGLPTSAAPNIAHEVGFPFNIRRALGGWKLLFMREDWVTDADPLSEQELRGRYLVEALGHCGECHTPRNFLGASMHSDWLSGAANPSGDGRIPDITRRRLHWSAFDIAAYLQTGFTPEFDTAGGSMVAMVQSLAHLPATDAAAIAAYVVRQAGPVATPMSGY
jgi:mono/diheme cytochrome c family protein